MWANILVINILFGVCVFVCVYVQVLEKNGVIIWGMDGGSLNRGSFPIGNFPKGSFCWMQFSGGQFSQETVLQAGNFPRIILMNLKNKMF